MHTWAKRQHARSIQLWNQGCRAGTAAAEVIDKPHLFTINNYLMGTVFDQPRRESLEVNEEEFTEAIQSLHRVAKKCKISLDQATEIWHVCQLKRANDLAVANGDVHDEQVAGIAGILQDIESNLRSIGK